MDGVHKTLTLIYDFLFLPFVLFFLSNLDERWGRKNHGQGGATIVIVNAIKKMLHSRHLKLAMNIN